MFESQPSLSSQPLNSAPDSDEARALDELSFTDLEEHLPGPAQAREEWEPKRDYVPKALFCLSVHNPVRRLMIQVIEHRFFEPIILTLIAVNCIILAVYDPLKPMDEGRNVIISGSESFFVAAFALEMVIKIIACGFLLDGRSSQVQYQGEKVRVSAYIRDGWNILDFVVVIAGIISLLPGVSGNFSALRTVRVLRPIRAISVMQGMRVLVGTMIKSIPMIGNVMLMLLFLFVIFGILGINVFQGKLRYRCFESGDSSANITAVDAANSTAVIDGNFTLVDDEQVCATVIKPWHGYICPGEEQCLNSGMNPNFNVTSFDNFFWACLTIFQVITLEGWTTVMYMCQDATTGWSFLYFIFIVFMGSFFILQLALGVITDVYEAEEAEIKHLNELEAKEKERLQRIELSKIGMTLEEFQEEEKGKSLAKAEEMEEGSSCDCLNIRKFCRALINTEWFKTGIMLMIVLNTVVLALEYYRMSEMYNYVVTTFNLALTFVFTAEMILKLTALGFRSYVEDRFNIFDAVVVLFSLLELVLGLVLGSQGGAALSGFRAFRILRVLKLVNSWRSLKSFITVLFKTLSELGNFCLIVLLVVFIFSLLGMMMFGGKMEVDGEVPRTNFDSLVWSAVTVFQVLTGEDWNYIMYDSIAATNAGAFVFYFALIVIGDFMILNLFVAILLSNFGNLGDDDDDDGAGDGDGNLKDESMLQQAKHASGWFGGIARCLQCCKGSQADLHGPQPSAGSVLFDGTDAPAADSPPLGQVYERQVSNPNKGAQRYALEDYEKNALFFIPPTSHIRKACFCIADDKRFDWLMMFLIFASSATIAVETPWMSQDMIEILSYVDLAFTSCFTLEMIIKVVALGFIRDKYSYLRDGWNILDFLVVTLSIVSLSFSSMDLSVVKTFRGLRMLRPLRVINRVPELKIVVNALFGSLPGIGNVMIVTGLFWLIFGILGMQLFLGKFYSCDRDRCCAPLQDSILDPSVSYQNCSDTFWDAAIAYNERPLPDNGTVCCIDGDSMCCEVKTVDQCIGECRWKNAEATFDNIYNSMLTLIEMCTTEGWAGVMYQGVDAVGIGYQPQRDHRVVMVLYFISFMIVGFFLIMNLFVGIILDKFAEEHKKGNNPLLSEDQAKWVKTQCRIMSKPLKKAIPEPENQARRAMYNLVESNAFDYVIMACIMLNTAVMATEHYQQDPAWTSVQEFTNRVFALIFMVEAGMKIIGLGIRGYFSRKGNIFDFILVSYSIVNIFLAESVETSFLRVFRVARVFRLVKSLRGLRILLNALLVSIPTIVNIGGLFFLLMFMYAVLGVNFFGRVILQEELNVHANFQNFGTALLTLLRIITGEAWNSIMYDCMVQPPDCDPSTEPYCALLSPAGELVWNTTDGKPVAAPGVVTEDACTCTSCSWRKTWDIDNCGTRYAPLYFVTFFLLAAFIMLNLIIAVVLENFSTSKEQNDEEVSENDFMVLRKKWAVFDPYAKGFIPMADLPRLVALVPPPLGLEGQKITRLRMLKFQRDLDVTPVDGNIYWHNVLSAFFQRTATMMDISQDNLPSHIQHQLEMSKRKMERKTVSGFGRTASNDSASIVSGADLYSVVLTQAAFRGARSRRELKIAIESDKAAEGEQLQHDISEHITGLLEAAKFAHENQVSLEEANRRRPASPIVTEGTIRPPSSFLFNDYSAAHDDAEGQPQRLPTLRVPEGHLESTAPRIPKTPSGDPVLSRSSSRSAKTHLPPA